MGYKETMGIDIDEGRVSKELQGKRLICEVSFSREEVNAWRQELIPKADLGWNLYSTLAAIATVGTGIYQYNGGDLWSAFPGLDTPADQGQWGQQFERFLQEHGSLESFQNLGGRRYVDPILAHGGIPQYCLPDFFHLLTHYGDPESPAEDFIDFIRDHPNTMVNIDKPVQRFLLYGGEVAEEFVARCIALWQSRESGDGGGTHGLPSRVIEAFSQWYDDNRPAQRQRVRRLPKPEIRLKPGDLWVYLRLPRCDFHPDIRVNSYWEVADTHLAVSRDHEIPLCLADNWHIKLEDKETVLQGISGSEPVIFFDPTTGKMIPNPRLRRLPECLWAVFGQSMEVEPEPTYKEGIPTWPGYVVAAFDLGGHLHLRVGDQQYEVRRPFFHVEEDPVVASVTSEEGLAVFRAPPRIQWEGEANFSLMRHGNHEGNIDIKSDDFQMWFDEPGEYEFILRGPFGQNVHKHFLLIPDLRISIQPEVMWPNTPRVECDVSVNQVGIYSEDGRTPPFIRHEPCIRSQAVFGEEQKDLLIRVPRLQWRVHFPGEEASEWSTKLIAVPVQKLEGGGYPRLVCEFGQSIDGIEVVLTGKHGSIRPPQGSHSVVSQRNTWEFDLRMVREQVQQSGAAEEFDISVQDTGGVNLYNGTVMEVRPEWDLQEFCARWKRQDGEHVVRVTWREAGNAISGRWLVLIPLWRPWEGAIKVHQLRAEERMSYEWHFPDIRPGRYVARAVHAPWGCDDWIEAKPTAQHIVDVSKDSWQETFSQQEAYTSVKGYAESLLVHWYRPQLVSHSPLAPIGISGNDIERFLNIMKQTDHLEAVQIPRDGSGSLTIFLHNPQATAKALEMEQDWPRIWERILPNKAIIRLAELSEQDRIIVLELIEHWVGGFDSQHFQESAKDTIKQAARLHIQESHLSEPIKKWFLNLKSLRRKSNKSLLPKPDDIIFVCERFSLVESGSFNHFLIDQYRKMKAVYQSREAV